jgi:hypothetical protein
MNKNIFDEADMILNNQKDSGIQSGGLSVKSVMLLKGLSPIMSINTNKQSDNFERVSDLFENLVIPLGLVNHLHKSSSNSCDYYDDRNIYEDYDENENENENENDVVNKRVDDLYEELLKLVEPESKELNKNNILAFGGKKKNKSRKTNAIKSNINDKNKSKKNVKSKINLNK